MEIKEIPLEKIHSSPDNLRKGTDRNLKELASSIKIVGVISPIALVENKDGYEIIFGERRWRASKLAGKKTIPAFVHQDINPDLVRHAENKNREDIDPFAEAGPIEEMMETMKLSEIAAVLGMPLHAVRLRANLSHLIPEFREAIDKDRKDASKKADPTPTVGLDNWPIHYFELIARFPEESQQRALSWAKKSWHVPSQGQVERILGDQESPLSEATWALDDGSLGKAGPCVECHKRKSIVHDLFEKVKADIDVAKDTCQDVVCFRRKRDIQKGRQLKELKEKHKATVISIVKSHEIPGELREKLSKKAQNSMGDVGARMHDKGIHTYWELKPKATKTTDHLLSKDGKLYHGLKLGTYEKPAEQNASMAYDTVGTWLQQYERKVAGVAEAACIDKILDKELMPEFRLALTCALLESAAASKPVAISQALKMFTINGWSENAMWLWRELVPENLTREGYGTPFKDLKDADEFYKSMDADFSQVVKEIREKYPIPKGIRDKKPAEKQPDNLPSVYKMFDK